MSEHETTADDLAEKVAAVLLDFWASDLDDDEAEFVRTAPESMEVVQAYTAALLPLIREREAVAWDEGFSAAEDGVFDANPYAGSEGK